LKKNYKDSTDMAADIDLDFADREHVLKLISHVPACQQQDGVIRRHNSGVYVTDIPRNALLDCAALDYETAEQRGYFKIDFLNMSVYKLIQSPEHYQLMLDREPPWQRLWQDPAWASDLVHVGNYTGLLATMRPDSIQRMAAFISIIRPGKAHLQNQSWDRVFASVWDGDDSRGYVFKKSHSVSYAALVALHMNLIDLAD
jgi:hypothetical protein